MDLNHIELSPALVADLFQSSLIETDEQTVVSTKTSVVEQPLIKWLGENKKKVLLIFNYTEAVYLPDEDLNFLTGILGACKLSIADVAIVNLNKYPGITYKELLEQLKSRTVFLFGVEPTALGLPMSFPQFQIQAFANCTFLFASTLTQLEADKTLKSKLWVCLKRIFII